MSPRSDRPAAPDLRVGDAERERVVAALRDHAAAGRLTVEELSERLDRAYAARTAADLSELQRDLPPTTGGAHAPPSTRRGSPQLAGFLLMTVLLLAIWAATGAGYFWPIWPILGLGIPLAMGARGARLGCRGRRGA